LTNEEQLEKKWEIIWGGTNLQQV